VIFNSFTQGSKEVTKEFGGLGLGLAISQATVDAHNGSLRAQSRGHDKGCNLYRRTAASVAREDISLPRVNFCNDDAGVARQSCARILIADGDQRRPLPRLVAILEKVEMKLLKKKTRKAIRKIVRKAINTFVTMTQALRASLARGSSSQMVYAR
jgi:hypothetical protein